MSRKRPQVRPEQVPIPARPSEPEAPKEEPESQESTPEVEGQGPAPDETPETPQSEQAPEQPTPDQPSEPTLADVFAILTDLKQMLSDQHEMLQSAPRARRKAMSNGTKVQVLDKETGEVFPSKNKTYQTLLKRGALKELVDRGIFGDDPDKNSFGWYALKRAWPDRFVESTGEGQVGHSAQS